MTVPYRWNPTLRRYVDARGRIVSGARVRAALDGTLRASGLRAAQLAIDLREGRLSLVQWEREMRVLVKDVHLYSAAGAKGGWAQLGPADFGRVGAVVKDQYAYLWGFAEDVASGKQRLDGSLVRRARMYAEAGRATYEADRSRELGLADFDEERNVLSPGDTCGGCVAETGRGWVKRGRLVPVGSRDCLTSCHCRIEHRRSAAARAARRQSAEPAARTRPYRPRKRAAAAR